MSFNTKENSLVGKEVQQYLFHLCITLILLKSLCTRRYNAIQIRYSWFTQNSMDEDIWSGKEYQGSVRVSCPVSGLGSRSRPGWPWHHLHWHLSQYCHHKKRWNIGRKVRGIYSRLGNHQKRCKLDMWVDKCTNYRMA